MGFFLEKLRMDSFGKYSQREVGPFKQHLNVLYGHNEAGKTTTTAFVGGVLFGYARNHGKQNSNTYAPLNGKQTGKLVFASSDGKEDSVVIERTGTKEVSPECAQLVQDLDIDTFDAVFSIDCSDFEALDSSKTLFAKMLTARAGTVCSPAAIKAAVDKHIQDQKSTNAAKAGRSYKLVAGQLKDVKEKIKAASQEEAKMATAEAELQRITPLIALKEERMRALKSAKANVERMADVLGEAVRAKKSAQGNLQSCSQDLRIAQESLAAFDAAHKSEIEKGPNPQAFNPQLAQEYAEKQAQKNRVKEEISQDLEFEKTKRSRRHTSKIIFAIFFILSCLCCIGSFFLSMLQMLIVGVISAGIFLLALIIAIILEAASAREVDRLTTKLSAQDNMVIQEPAINWALVLGDRWAAELAHNRSMLDQKAIDARSCYVKAESVFNTCCAEEEACLQEARTLVESLQFLLIPCQEISEEGLKAYERALEDAKDEEQKALNGLVHEQSDHQATLSHSKETLGSLKVAQAQLEQELADIADQVALWAVESMLLGQAIEKYAGETQSDFSAKANEFFSLLTGGAWSKIETDEHGQAFAVNAFGDKLEDVRLSTGTKQQMYLSLRLALLVTNTQAGANIPVLCDDILVNFDETRRVAAAKAIAEVAKVRQVLLFTCHPEVVEALQAADPSLNLVELDKAM